MEVPHIECCLYEKKAWKPAVAAYSCAPSSGEAWMRSGVSRQSRLVNTLFQMSKEKMGWDSFNRQRIYTVCYGCGVSSGSGGDLGQDSYVHSSGVVSSWTLAEQEEENKSARWTTWKHFSSSCSVILHKASSIRLAHNKLDRALDL